MVKVKKRRREASDSDSELDDELQRILEARLEAHCARVVGHVAGPEVVSAPDPEPCDPAGAQAEGGFMEDLMGATKPGTACPFPLPDLALPQRVAAKQTRHTPNGPEQPADSAQPDRQSAYKAFMSSKISNVRNCWEAKKGSKAPKAYNKPLEETFKGLAAEILDFGSQQFTGREKKAHEAQKARALGAKVPKSPKVPIRLLEKMNKSLNKKNQRLKEQCNASGARYEPQTVLSCMRGTQGELRQNQKQQAARTRNPGLSTGVGQFKNGMLKIRKGDMKGLKPGRVDATTATKSFSGGGKGKGKGKGKGR